MIKILTIGLESEGAKRLDLPLQIYKFQNGVEHFDNDIVIRWGQSRLSSSCSGIEKEFKNVLNPAKAIVLNSHKYKASVLLAQNVLTPRLFEKEIPAGVRAVVRKIAHAAGSEFAIKDGPLKLAKDEYGAEFLETDTEFRVWFCGNATMMAKRMPMKCNEKEDMRCRANWMYSFKGCEKVPTQLHNDVLKAAAVMGLEFGAADILFINGKYYFLELNSACTIDLLKIERFYKSNLLQLAKSKFENFDSLAQMESMKTEGYIFPEESQIID